MLVLFGINMVKFSFKVENNDNKARAGIIKTKHGKIKTPVLLNFPDLGCARQSQ